MKKAANFNFLMAKEAIPADSECCSGCQSGWTLYLDHSQSTADHSAYFPQEEEEEEEEEEDLSMISDASSGPRNDEGNGCLCNAVVVKNGIKRRRDEEEQQEKKDCFLDDTASSPLFTFSKDATSGNFGTKKILIEDDHSCSFSATHFKGKNALRQHLGYLHSSTGI